MSSIIKLPISRLTGTNSSEITDTLAVEEPLEIRIGYSVNSKQLERNISITMRTPGNDEELAIGFLFTEGIIETIDQINSINSISENIIIISLRDNVNIDLKKLERNFYTTSSCGVCGKSSIEAINTLKKDVILEDNYTFQAKLIYSLPTILREHQNVFEQTGGLHASAIFDQMGKLLLLREDVGRHNALDKLIGSAFKNKLLPFQSNLLLLSGRASFELIQKATMAGISIVAAVGAPSSLAVELAKDRGMTLIGFLKNDKFNIYCGKERIDLD